MLNQVWSGGRSAVADQSAKSGGAAFGATAGSMVDTVGSTILGAAGQPASDMRGRTERARLENNLMPSPYGRYGA